MSPTEPIAARSHPEGPAGSARGSRYVRAPGLSPRGRRALRIAALILPALIVLAVILVYPLLNMIGLSFYKEYPGPFAFTLEHYAAFLTDRYFLNMALTTFALAMTVTAMCAVIGYPVAYYLVRSRSKLKHLIFLVVISPLLVSIVIRTIGWTIILGNEGLINSTLLASGVVDQPLRLMDGFWSVVVGMVHVLLPFMVLSIAAVIGKIDPSLPEAAATLGAHPARSFLFVTLPLSIRGIAAGSILVFCITIGSYIIPRWLSRGKLLVLSIEIYNEVINFVNWPFGAAASTLLSAATVVLLVVYLLVLRRLEHR
ncbi:MAG: ABC transporter permease [Thermomicrobiales bacterium]|nr:ABC transporter permease [Thermomicrobiales bacterium]